MELAIAIHGNQCDYRTTLLLLQNPMAGHFEFDSANRILRCRVEGQITAEMLQKYCRLAERFAAQTRPRAAIMDMSLVDGFKGSTKGIREIANAPPALGDPSVPVCIVATSPQIYGIARMFELQGQDTRPNLHVVRTQKEALAILGVQEPKFEGIQLK